MCTHALSHTLGGRDVAPPSSDVCAPSHPVCHPPSPPRIQVPLIEQDLRRVLQQKEVRGWMDLLIAPF